MSRPMDTIPDFEDMLTLFDKHGVKCLVIGGLAFVFHVKPRFTKDMDVWVGCDPENLRKVNLALAEFGSPQLLDIDKDDQVLQVGVAPNRVDILTHLDGPVFEDAWRRRIRATYGKAPVNWIDLDGLLDIKARIDDPRHQSDARYLRKVKEMKKKALGKKSGKKIGS